MVPAYPRRQVQEQVCDAVAEGWTLARLAARPGWPSRQTVHRWTLEDAGFAARLREARGWRRGLRTQAGPVFDPVLAEAFLLAVRRGDAVRDLVRRPPWPNRDRLNRWKRERPDFAAALEVSVRFALQERPRRWARYDEAVADEVVRRLNGGTPISRLWSDPSLPGKAAMRIWRRRRPEFDHAVKTAERAGHRRRMAAGRKLTPEMFNLVLERLAEGRSLRQVGMLPGMPHRVTLQAWMKRDPEFADMVRWAREEGRIGKVMEEGARRIAAADALG